eukprot:Rhum_TRINITY_DN14470_c36_g1::Rhum_TRINITY_DN14470_c36_g1_i1::g.91677::m.91677
MATPPARAAAAADAGASGAERVWGPLATLRGVGPALCADPDTDLVYCYARDHTRGDACGGTLWAVDPTTGAASQAARGPYVGDCSVCFAGGSVVVCGGRCRGFEKWEAVRLSTEAFTYCVKTGKARTVDIAAAPAMHRYGHAGVPVAGGKYVLAFGGQQTSSKFLNDVVLFDWEQGSSLCVPAAAFSGCPPCPRSGHAAASHASGSGDETLVFVSGGVAHTGKPCSDLYQLHCPSMAWRELVAPHTLVPRSLLADAALAVVSGAAAADADDGGRLPSTFLFGVRPGGGAASAAMVLPIATQETCVADVSRLAVVAEPRAAGAAAAASSKAGGAAGSSLAAPRSLVYLAKHGVFVCVDGGSCGSGGSASRPASGGGGAKGLVAKKRTGVAGGGSGGG